MPETTHLARACTDCGAAPGADCSVPIAGVDTTGWTHDARILAPVYADLAAAADR